MKLKFCLILFQLSLFISLNAQTDKKDNPAAKYKYENELGINFTNVLGNVLSLNPNNANSPYGLTYRRHFKNWTFRSGIDFAFTSKDNFDFSDGLSQQISLNERYAAVRIGMQKSIFLTDHLIFGYGLDLLVNYDYEKSEAFIFFGNFNRISDTERLLSFGLGPMLRLEYKISDRVFLSTESTLYGTIGTKKNIFDNGAFVEERSTDEFSLKLVLPQSLFINILF
ncbi:MAG: hypothetical protein IPM42_13610 [Saprospiraceae bacterium]|nr:hypothetical protein [Saprospiraceae bacterium]